MELKWIKLTDTVLKSIVYKTIVDFFLDNKNIDTSKFISSIIIRDKKFKIKTSSSTFKSELLLYEAEIKKSLKIKFSKIWYTNDFDIQIF